MKSAPEIISFNEGTTTSVKWIVSGFLSMFLAYSLAQKFNLFESKKSSKERTEWIRVVKTWFTETGNWIWTSFMVFKSFFGDGIAMYHIIVNYLNNCKDTPRDIWVGLFHLVYVNKPDDLQVVLNNTNALEKSGIYNFFKKGLGEGLITAPVAKWKKNRRIISPLFSSRHVEGYFHVFNEHSTELVKKFEKYTDTNEYFDLWIPVSKTTLTMIWDVAIGTDLNISDDEKERILKTFVKVTELFGLRVYRLWLYPVFMFRLYSTLAGYRKYFAFASSLPKKVLAGKKEKVKEKLEIVKKLGEGAATFSYMDQFLKESEGESKLTDREIIHEGNTMLAAGSETNALTISFTLMMLAMNPDIQEKVYQEIIKYSGDDDNDLNIDQVHKMTYLEQCVRETLRLYPPIPFLMRTVTNSFQINENYTAQENSNIIIPVIMVHRDPNIYPNPLQWNPDNFSAENIESRHKYSFLAFSAGLRGCIGNKYALLAVKITLSKILKNYRLVTDWTNDDIKVSLEIVTRSSAGYKIKMFSRKKPRKLN